MTDLDRKIMNEYLSRLGAMVAEGQQTWDFSPNDVAAIRGVLSLVGKLRDALESLVDHQNGPPLLKKSWLDGWNVAMAKAAELLGRKHERQEL